MGIRRTFFIILLPLAILMLALLVFALNVKIHNVKVGLLAFAVSFIISTLMLLMFCRIIEVSGYERLIISRGGRFVDTGRRGGRAFLIRGLDKPIRVDLRSRTESVPDDRCFTKEGIGIDINYFFLWRVVDPMRFLLGPKDIPGTLKGMASAILKTEVGKMSLEEVLMQRDNISAKLKTDLGKFDKAEEWGIEFITIELGSMRIPADVEEAMSRSMAATKKKEAILIEMQARAEAFDELRNKIGGDALLIQVLKDIAETFGRKT